MNASITAIINLYQRPETVAKIVRALNAQTVPIDRIEIFQNGTEKFKGIPPVDNFVRSNENLGVWARFAHALNVETDFVVIFDDDTIPGPEWIANCLIMQLAVDGGALCGTVGLKLKSKTNYQHHERFGWPSPNRDPVQVDLVGHSWFFRREWLATLWIEQRPEGFNFVGEDMHLSYAFQKFLNIPTFVPPHPPGDKARWGSLDGFNVGTDAHSIWESNKDDARNKMDLYLQHLVSKGWKLLDV